MGSRLRIDGSLEWLEGVRRLQSPNCDARPPGCCIDLLVVHGISLPPGEFGGPFIDDLFLNRLEPDTHPYFGSIHRLRVSAHVLIRRDGTVTQYVPFGARAWHAGESVFDGRANCNDYSIGVELEGADTVSYEAIQYRRLTELTRLLMAAWPTIGPTRIVRHSDIAPGRKTDPGPAFDWERFRQRLNAPEE